LITLFLSEYLALSEKSDNSDNSGNMEGSESGVIQNHNPNSIAALCIRSILKKVTGSKKKAGQAQRSSISLHACAMDSYIFMMAHMKYHSYLRWFI